MLQRNGRRRALLVLAGLYAAAGSVVDAAEAISPSYTVVAQMSDMRTPPTFIEAASASYTLTNRLGDPPVTFAESASFLYTVTNLLSDPPTFRDAASGAYTVAQTVPVAVGDLNRDGYVDTYDYQKFFACFTSPGGGMKPDCNTVDIHRDGDVDLHDYCLFMRELRK